VESTGVTREPLARLLAQLRSAPWQCILICMRTTLDIDETLVRQALKETGAKSKTDVIEMGLKLVLEREARKRIKLLRGRLPAIERVPRRRPAADLKIAFPRE
jgi:Arc/MetJ family transcription regulator